MDTIQNDYLEVHINREGAEVSSMRRLSDGRECVWQGDPAYWRRRSPVLFPIVGSLWEGRTRIEGRIFRMSQHGFARDRVFTLHRLSADAASYRLRSDEQTLALFPYEFELEIAYRLVGPELEVEWRVCNLSDRVMPFQIGGHPAFLYKDYDPEAPVQGYLQFGPAGRPLVTSVIGEKGCLGDVRRTLPLDADGLLPITRHTFEDDALILENAQVDRVTLLDRQKRPYLTVGFDGPLMGIWSPRKDEYAPFVCIEPWYGRADRAHYEGEFDQREWVQRLEPGRHFVGRYTVGVVADE